MEKSEKRRFSMKPKLEPVEKAKNTRRNSKMIKTKTQENEIQQQQNQPAPPNTMIQNTVPIMQAQYYGMQPTEKEKEPTEKEKTPEKEKESAKKEKTPEKEK